jgi:hypothetical protein
MDLTRRRYSCTLESCSASIILVAGLAADVKPQFPDVHANLTWVLSVSFCVDLRKRRSMPVQWILERNCGVRFNNLQAKYKVQAESLKTSFFFSRWTRHDSYMGKGGGGKHVIMRHSVYNFARYFICVCNIPFYFEGWIPTLISAPHDIVSFGEEACGLMEGRARVQTLQICVHFCHFVWRVFLQFKDHVQYYQGKTVPILNRFYTNKTLRMVLRLLYI